VIPDDRYEEIDYDYGYNQRYQQGYIEDPVFHCKIRFLRFRRSFRPPAFLSPEFELFGGRYPQESDSKNSVCQGINVTKQKDNGAGDLGWVAPQTGLIRPLVDNVIYKIYNKSDTDQEIRAARQIKVFMGDHEIDLVDAEKDNIQTGKNAKVRREIIHTSEYQIFSHPDDTREGKYGVGYFFSHPEETPDKELPKNEDPFQQGIDIGDIRVACLSVISKIDADHLGSQPCKKHKKKGQVGFAKAAKTNQPRNTG
jgi:hypothetical protein